MACRCHPRVPPVVENDRAGNICNISAPGQQADQWCNKKHHRKSRTLRVLPPSSHFGPRFPCGCYGNGPWVLPCRRFANVAWAIATSYTLVRPLRRPQAPKSRAHHCSRCGACVARMDHHCIYVANCVGAGNQKQFLLLLLYSAASAAYANFLYFCVIGTSRWDATLAEASAAASLPSTWGAALLACRRRVTWMGGGLLLLFSWVVVILAVHLYGLLVDAGTVDRMQASSTKGREVELKTTYEASAWHGDERSKWTAIMTKDKAQSPPVLFSNTLPTLSADDTNMGIADISSGKSPSWSSAGRGNNGARCGCSLGGNLSRWGAFRQEVFGDGPWWMWFVPSPAKLSSEVRDRVYSLH